MSPKNTKLVLTIDQDRETEKFQIGLWRMYGPERGVGCRLLGPKYEDSETIQEQELSEMDAEVILRMINNQFPNLSTERTP